MRFYGTRLIEIYLYRQAEDYFFRGISLKCLNLGDGANAYMTGGAELNFIYITRNTNALGFLYGVNSKVAIFWHAGCWGQWYGKSKR